MNDRIANQIASFRTRLECLDHPAHTAIWRDVPPVIFTIKVTQARAALDTLVTDASRQSVPRTGTAADKRREERELEDAAHALARAVVTFAADKNDLAMAHKHDLSLSGWRGMRDEALLQRARLLQTDALTLTTAADADFYGITPAAVAALGEEADDYAACIAAPQDTIAERASLTASLPQQVRALTSLFDQLENLLPQFRAAPGGPAFLAAYRAAAQIIDRGHGPGYGTPAPVTPPPTPPST